MSERVQADRTDPVQSASTPYQRGPGRWLLTWAGVFGVVILTAIVFIVAAFIAGN